MDSNNFNTSAELRNVLFGEQTEGYVHLFIPKLNNLVLWHHISDWDDVIADVKIYSEKYEVFIGVNLSDKPKSAKQRTKLEDILAIQVVPIDFDILDEDAHKKISLPKTRQEVYDFIKETPFHEKIHLNDSGYGVHGYILLNVPFFITDEKSRRRAEALSKDTVNYIRKLAKELRGWDFDAVGDLPRLMRLLGSFNHKKNEKRLVKVLARTTYRFSAEGLEALIPTEAKKKRSSRNLLEEWQKTKPSPDKKAELQPIAQGCRFVRHGIENSETLSEPHWHALITLIARCENGRELAHEVSEAYPRYSQAQTNKKVDSAIESETGPATCNYIRGQLLFPACRTCPLSASKMKLPISLGFIDGYLAGLFSQFVYDIKTKRLYEINPPKEAL